MNPHVTIYIQNGILEPRLDQAGIDRLIEAYKTWMSGQQSSTSVYEIDAADGHYIIRFTSVQAIKQEKTLGQLPPQPGL